MNLTMTSNSSIFLDLASRGARLPIGTDLVLSEKNDHKAIKLDGGRLGRVMEEAARRWKTPLAFPLMDLALEKEWLLGALEVPATDIPTWHFGGEEVPQSMPEAPLTPRLQANVEAIRYIANETDLFPCGMSIGPFSLMTKLLSDPISAVYMAGMGEEDDDVTRLERILELGTGVILRSIKSQLEAGAKAVVLCEPAANTVYFSPNQMKEGADTFDRYVMALNQRICNLLRENGAALIFHDCGELMEEMVVKLGSLKPAMISFGSSRNLWDDAALMPKDTVIYGNLPTKKFYSDEVLPISEVRAMARNLLKKMAATGRPFILGSECDVLSVPGSEKTIRDKVNAFLSV